MKRISIFALVLSVFVWVQPTRTQTPQPSSQPPSDFVVVDHAGKIMGPVIGVDSNSHVTIIAVSFHGKLLPVEVLRSSFLVVGGLFFKASDCTGQPYLDASGSPFLATTVSGPGTTLYAESGPVQSITAASGIDRTGSCFETSIPFAEAAPVTPTINLNMFTPPFRVVSKD